MLSVLSSYAVNCIEVIVVVTHMCPALPFFCFPLIFYSFIDMTWRTCTRTLACVTLSFSDFFLLELVRITMKITLLTRVSDSAGRAKLSCTGIPCCTGTELRLIVRSTWEVTNLVDKGMNRSGERADEAMVHMDDYDFASIVNQDRPFIAQERFSSASEFWWIEICLFLFDESRCCMRSRWQPGKPILFTRQDNGFQHQETLQQCCVVPVPLCRRNADVRRIRAMLN